ncbi:hypothetical protein [Nocardioides ochotonae]|uniref:hypothetical protein n=1 Tax=Nocardioides ochotonae TaxID=2685869 RepID=UPI001CD4EF38|nr:hypothetical protein [Nocardioides ochotonae]
MFDLANLPAPNWGPTGETVFTRTYARPNPDGSPETWAETVRRVVVGNLGLVYGDPETWPADVVDEARLLFDYIYHFKILPAGRHLWASGVKGRQFLFNCHVSGWGDTFAGHFAFTFLRLMEGGGVGANYSSRFLTRYGAPRRRLRLHIVADPEHADYDAMREAGLLSDEYAADWPGAYRIEDTREGWAAALVDLIETYFADDVRHPNRVYDVSLVRPEARGCARSAAPRPARCPWPSCWRRWSRSSTVPPTPGRSRRWTPCRWITPWASALLLAACVGPRACRSSTGPTPGSTTSSRASRTRRSTGLRTFRLRLTRTSCA